MGDVYDLRAEVEALRAALAGAVVMLRYLDADANNLQLDIARWARFHHVALEHAGVEL